MSFDWETYVELAKELSQRSEQNCLRNSISRAYYGVFCICRNLKYLQNYRGDIHERVINEYRTSKITTEKHIGKLLGDLRRNRNDADYTDSFYVEQSFVKRVLLKQMRYLICLIAMPHCKKNTLV